MEAVIDKIRGNEISCHQPVPAQRNGWNYEDINKLSRARVSEKSGWKSKKLQVVITSLPDEQYKKAEERIDKLCQNADNPDAPNQTARELALTTLKLLWTDKITPSLINPSGDEGLFFEFFVKDNYYLFKFCNSGEIVYLKRVAGQPKIVKEISIQQLEDTTKEITSAYRNTDV